ncbi:MAG: hypothetical protein MUC49_02025 [Raineya sp.]|jgi:hypothetical protein|nr:hypothetical protein [Raineya sp.]
MKILIFRFIIPLTIISFIFFTKWWFVLPNDAPHTMLSGFPFPFVGDGWHTSLSLQFFIIEFILDFLIYFLFWYLLIFLINRFIIQIRIPKNLFIVLWSISLIFIFLSFYIVINSEPAFDIKRDWDMQILETGYKPLWKHQEKPD